MIAEDKPGGHENLPAVPDAVEVEETLIEGEVVSETRPPVVVLRPVVRVVRVVLVVVRHEHTRTVTRHVSYVLIGGVVVARRVWESRTTARYDRFIRAAEIGGNHDAALQWDERRAEFVRARHDRRMQRAASRIHTAKAVPVIAIAVVIVLFTLGVLLAVANRDPADVALPVEVLARITAGTAAAVSVAWGPLVLAAPWAALGLLWHAGRREAAGMPGWGTAGSRDTEEAGLVLTADTIVLALQHLPIQPLKAAFKEGWRPVFYLEPVRDGRGYSAVFGVPLGCTAEMIADQRPVLARNLHRAEVETWPSDGSRNGAYPAGSVELWIADPGVLSKPAPEYPLLHEGTADVFHGVPAGISPRGDVLMVPVVGNNMVAGGQMGQGKSNACRVVMLGCATDPLCELDVFVFANNGDFDAYAPRLALYRKGLDDEVLAAAVARLHELYEEVARREGRLAELGAKKVTRGLAEAHEDLRPIVALFSECHELFGHPEYGALAAELATKTAKRARKTAITLLFDTQSSRKEAIPPKLVELVSVNVCFYVKTWRSNDGFLGDGSFAAGIRATELRPGRDRGTSVITGVSDAQFELLRWYFIEVDDDRSYDAAAAVIARTLAQVAAGTPVAANSPAPAIEARDLLADLAEVTRDAPARVRLADLPARLRKLAPAWAPYRSITGTQLAAELDDAGVRIYSTGNVPQADPADIRRAAEGSDEDGYPGE